MAMPRCSLTGGANHWVHATMMLLAIKGELSAAILLVAAFILLGAELLLLAVRDHAQTVGAHASTDERGLCGIGTIFTKGQVVLRRSALIAVTADDDFDRRVGCQIRCSTLGGGRCVRTQIIAVIAEEDVLHVLVERSFGAHIALIAGVRRGSDGNTNGHAYIRFRRSASIVLGHKVEVCRRGRRDSLRTVQIDIADTVDGNRGRTLCAPVRTADWPRSMDAGSAVSVAVGTL